MNAPCMSYWEAFGEVLEVSKGGLRLLGCQVHKYEMAKATKALCWPGEFRILWKALDKDGKNLSGLYLKPVEFVKIDGFTNESQVSYVDLP